MDDKALLAQLSRVIAEPADTLETWQRSAELLAALDAIGRTGTVVLVKVDGLRVENVYSVVVTGGRIGEDPFRMDGADLRTLLVEAIAFVVSRLSASAAR